MSLSKPRITTIIATSPIPTMPDILHLSETVASLGFVRELAESPIIIVFDGVTTPLPLYDQYKANVEKAFAERPNIKLIYLSEWGHLSGAMARAIDAVTTEYIFVLQHDLPLVRSFDVDAVLACLSANPEVKHVRLNRRANMPVRWDDTILFREYRTPQLTLTRTGCWSDQSHLCKTSYYRDIVLPRLVGHRGFPEKVMNRLLRADEATMRADHIVLGTYLYGPPGEPPVIRHSDGRRTSKEGVIVRDKTRTKKKRNGLKRRSKN